MSKIDQAPPKSTSDQKNHQEHTIDRFFNGKVMVKQGKSGYRFSIDAVLLAGFAHPKTGETIMDVGTGCGIIPLLLAFTHPDLTIYGIEIQKELADIALENVSQNKMEDQIRIIYEDIKKLKFDQINRPVDLMVSNPPYRQIDSGKINPNTQKAHARHEISVTLPDVMSAARRFLKVSGRLVMIYPAKRAVDLIFNLRKFDIEPKTIQMIHSYEDTPATLMIVESINGGGEEVNVLAPLYIYKNDGSYSDAVQKLMAGK